MTKTKTKTKTFEHWTVIKIAQFAAATDQCFTVMRNVLQGDGQGYGYG